MYEAFQAEVARLVLWVKKAELLEERQVLWCIAQLPDAFRELTRTYESRYAEVIARHQQAAIHRLNEDTGPTAGLLADKLRGKFQSLNEGFGLPALVTPQPRRLISKTKRPRANKKPATPI